MDKSELGKALYEISHIMGGIQLRSGMTSEEYFDKYLFESQPTILKEIAQSMIPLVPYNTDVLAGLEMGGIPVVTVLSQLTGIPTAFVRKECKTYGTCKLAEGAEIVGKRVCLVGDVVISGGQIILSVNDLRSLGANVDTVLCIVDWESGATEKLKSNGLELRPLYTEMELKMSCRGPSTR